MTPQEHDLLQNFLQDLVRTRGVTKDPQAESMILDAMRASPDAPYLLVQHAIMSDQALHAAQDQIAQLQDQLRNTPAQAEPTRFLGSAPSPWAQAAAPQPAPQAQPQSQWQPQPPPRYDAGPGPFSGGGGLGSFLRNAGTTAAGVAGGAFLFEGISNLFGGGRGGFGGGYGGGFGGGGFGGGPTEIVNNYYEDGPSGSDDFGGGGDGGGFDDGGSNDF